VSFEAGSDPSLANETDLLAVFNDLCQEVRFWYILSNTDSLQYSNHRLLKMPLQLFMVSIFTLQLKHLRELYHSEDVINIIRNGIRQRPQNQPVLNTGEAGKAKELAESDAQLGPGSAVRRQFGWIPLTTSDTRTVTVVESTKFPDQSLTILEICQQFERGIERLKINKRGMRRTQDTISHSATLVSHRCQGYRREEVILGPRLLESVVLMSSNPTANEICFLCGEKIIVRVNEGTSYTTICALSTVNLTRILLFGLRTPSVRCTQR
jgi:hypothetical protein